MAARIEMIERVAGYLVGLDLGHPVRVAVDGITAGGKSALAAELTGAVAARGRAAVHLSTDDYHHVAEHRHRDPDRARGYYRDAYDLAAFRRLVLDPLGPGGSGRYQPKWHDLASDEILPPTSVAVAEDAVVVVDGSFLQSSALAGGWDEIVWLDTSFAAAVARGSARDAAMFGGEAAARAAFAERYHAACRLYIDEVAPEQHATIVIANEILEAPRLLRLP